MVEIMFITLIKETIKNPIFITYTGPMPAILFEPITISWKDIKNIDYWGWYITDTVSIVFGQNWYWDWNSILLGPNVHRYEPVVDRVFHDHEKAIAYIKSIDGQVKPNHYDPNKDRDNGIDEGFYLYIERYEVE